jgi:hypothetical protein
MIIYNVTLSVDKTIHDEWFRWMKEVHIPEVMATGYFIEYKMCKVLVDEDTGITYSIQYTCLGLKDLEEYQLKHAPTLQKSHEDKYKDKFVAFRTILEVV